MKINEIIEFLNENGLSEVEELRAEKDLVLLNFYLDFDKDLLEAAKAYADEECKDAGSKEWEQEYYIPYLYDYANDEVLSIVEDITEDFEIAGEFMAFQIKDKNAEYVQFMTLFTEEDSDVIFEDIVREFVG